MPQKTPPSPFSCQSDLLISPLTQVSFGGAQEACLTGLYTYSGECCRACNLGEGVAQPCGANQTVCEPCLDSEYRVAGVGRREEPEGGARGWGERPCKSSASWQGLLRPAAWASDLGRLQDRRQEGEAEKGGERYAEEGGDLVGDPEGEPLPSPPQQRSLVPECGQVGGVADTKTS